MTGLGLSTIDAALRAFTGRVGDASRRLKGVCEEEGEDEREWDDRGDREIKRENGKRDIDKHKNGEKHKHADEQTDRQTDRQIDRQTDGQRKR